MPALTRPGERRAIFYIYLLRYPFREVADWVEQLSTKQRERPSTLCSRRCHNGGDAVALLFSFRSDVMASQ